jgi:RNA polymerase sigma-70 factor (ECF subfamily)
MKGGRGNVEEVEWNPEVLEPDRRGESASEVLTQRERRAILRRAIDQLDQPHRRVLVLHDVEGMTSEAIAQAFGEPSGTIRSRLHYARKRLRVILRGDYPEYFGQRG